MKGQTKAQLRHLRMSPQKVRLLVDLVRGLPMEEALVQLQFSRKQAALPLRKLLLSASANAENNQHLKKESLVIETIYADEGPVLHRWMPRAMGRATPLRKRSSHITVILSGEVDEVKLKAKEKEKKAKKVTKSEKTKKESTKKTEEKIEKKEKEQEKTAREEKKSKVIKTEAKSKQAKK